MWLEEGCLCYSASICWEIPQVLTCLLYREAVTSELSWAKPSYGTPSTLGDSKLNDSRVQALSLEACSAHPTTHGSG